uniref:Uncharacterized protein LOC105040004 isoform X2 n=1 Tax=Elaeis guineensis var. tenera TaxID=51953 RepID=A0A8N4ETT0_ELAGV|nr:uncharacterized protein LOC105040004 isoform X2 [Elaeis guineensis]
MGFLLKVVQGRRCFMWEMPRPSQEDISILEAKFNDLVVFSEVELQRTSKKWKTAAVGKFLGQGFPLEFVQKELKNRCSWRVTFSAWLTSSQRIRRLLRFSCTIPPTTRFRLFGACCLLLTLWCYVFWNVNCQGDANEESLYKKKKNTQGLIKAASGGMGCGSYKRANKPGESCLVHNIKQQKGSKTFKLRTEKQQFQNICYFIIG